MSNIDLSTIKNNGPKNMEKPVEKKMVKIIEKPREKPVEKPQVNLSSILKPDDSKTGITLNTQQRNKTIALLNLYVAEFPDKLKKYKSRDFNKLDNDELLEMKSNFQREVTTSSSIGMITNSSTKILEVYEYFMVNYADINIKGFSHNLANSEEYKECIKAVLLKYMSDSLVGSVEPEYKLLYMIISGSIMAHASNSLMDSQQKVQKIESNKPQSINNPEDDILKNIKIKNINFDRNYSDL